MKKNNIIEKTFKILSTQLGIEENIITLDSNINNDLGADSLDKIELIMSFEDTFKIDFPDNIIDNIKTVKDIILFINNKDINKK